MEIHWWFAGTWAIGWMITICSFAYATRQLFRKLATAKGGAITYSTACAVLWLGVVTWNLSFIDLRSPKGRFSNEIYRMLGRTLPRDGYPLVVADFPDLFGEYPFATAYLRRPIVRYDSSGDPFDSHGALFIKLGTTEDAMSDLINRHGFAGDLVYIAYDVSKRQCAFEDVNLEQWDETVPLRVCRVRVRSLLQNPARLWSTSVSTTAVDVGSSASTFTVRVSAPLTWTWSAAGNGDFIGLTSPTPITGPGTATFNVQPNPGFARLSTVTVAGQPVRITQTGMAGFENCVSDLGVQDRWRALGGIRTAQASVSASVGCVWVATSTAPWISLSARSGTGDGRFSYTVAPNVGPDARTGSVVVGGRTAKVVELPCWYTRSAIAVNVRAQGETVKLTLTGECTWTWTAVSEDAFVRVVSGKTGTGSGAVTFVVAPNTGAAREATLKIAGYKVAAIQAGS